MGEMTKSVYVILNGVKNLVGGWGLGWWGMGGGGRRGEETARPLQILRRGASSEYL